MLCNHTALATTVRLSPTKRYKVNKRKRILKFHRSLLFQSRCVLDRFCCCFLSAYQIKALLILSGRKQASSPPRLRLVDIFLSSSSGTSCVSLFHLKAQPGQSAISICHSCLQKEIRGTFSCRCCRFVTGCNFPRERWSPAGILSPNTELLASDVGPHI